MKALAVMGFILTHPLNRGKRMSALLRFVRWQIASRLLPEAEFALPYIDGNRLWMTQGMTGATGNFYSGLHEPDEMGFVLHVLRQGDLFVDVGANIGSYSVLAASKGAQVIAVEPIPATYERLVANLRLNRMESAARPVCLGLSDQKKTLRFSVDEDTVNHVLTDDEDAPCKEIDVVTLDSIVGDRAPTVIKIDVEGHELAVLMGATKTFSASSLLAVIIETNSSGLRYGVLDAQLHAFMEARGFEAYRYSATRKALQRADDSSRASAENTIFLALGKLPETQSRIATAPRSQLVNASI